MDMQCMSGTRRRIGAPHRLDQRVEVDDQARLYGERGQDGAFPCAPDGRRRAVPPTQLHRPQQPYVNNGSSVVGHSGTLRHSLEPALSPIRESGSQTGNPLAE